MAVIASGAHRLLERTAIAAALVLFSGAALAVLGTDELGSDSARLISLVLVALAPAAIIYGIRQEFRETGQITLHTMFGGLCLYLLIGIFFANALESVQSISDQAMLAPAVLRRLGFPLFQLRLADDHRLRRRGRRDQPRALVRDQRSTDRADLPGHRRRADRRQPAPQGTRPGLSVTAAGISQYFADATAPRARPDQPHRRRHRRQRRQDRRVDRARARARAPTLVIFPELCIPGYPAEDLYLKRALPRANERALRSSPPRSRGSTALVGFAEPIRRRRGPVTGSPPRAHNSLGVLAERRGAGRLPQEPPAQLRASSTSSATSSPAPSRWPIGSTAYARSG